MSLLSSGRLSVAAVLAISVACSAAPQTEDEANSIVNGSFSVGDEGVVALLVNNAVVCTGTLVTPEIVVTAAHCVPPHIQVDVEEISVFFGSDVADGGEIIAASAALGYPGWMPSDIAGDVGVIALSRPASTEPIPMLAQPLEMTDPVGQTVRMVGFGVAEAGGGGSGLKRSGEMEVESIDESSIRLSPGPASTCNGDSGGALLLDVGGVEMLAGIHSRSDCTSTSINERVDVHARGFILEVVESLGGGALCGSDGLCAEGCSSPDPDCLCGDDDMCTDDCMEPETDPDCQAACESGECGSSLAGCNAGGAPRGGALVLVLFALLALSRRRLAAVVRR